MKRTHPMSTDIDPSATENSVEPPPMSTTTNGPRAGSSPVVAPRNVSRPSSSPESSSGSAPTTSAAGPKKSVRLAASRAAEVAVMRGPTGCHAEAVHHRPVVAQHVQGPLDGIGVQPAAGVDALAEAGDHHAPLEGAEAAVAVGLGHQQAGRVGAAVEGGDALAAQRHGRTSSRWASTQRPTGSSPPASSQA